MFLTDCSLREYRFLQAKCFQVTWELQSTFDQRYWDLKAAIFKANHSNVLKTFHKAGQTGLSLKSVIYVYIMYFQKLKV